MKHRCQQEVQMNEEEVKTLKDTSYDMEEYYQLGNFFKMYSDPTRLRILHLLFQKPLCVCEIASLLEMSHSSISHQLAILRQHHMIQFQRVGKNKVYALDDQHIKEIFELGYVHMNER